VAQSLNNLGSIFQSQKEFAQAQDCYFKAQAIFEKNLGPKHTSTLAVLDNLVTLYCDQQDFNKAESIRKKIKDIKAAPTPAKQ